VPQQSEPQAQARGRRFGTSLAPGSVFMLIHAKHVPLFCVDACLLAPQNKGSRLLTAVSVPHHRADCKSRTFKLLDFGLAKDVRFLSTVQSQAGPSLGSPAYMSCEWCGGEGVDQRSGTHQTVNPLDSP